MSFILALNAETGKTVWQTERDELPSWGTPNVAVTSAGPELVTNLRTGEEVYRQRLDHLGSGFSASPVAADGKIYLSGEDGEMLVLEAGPRPRHIAKNSMGELLMATPALSDGVMYVRSSESLFAIGRRQ